MAENRTNFEIAYKEVAPEITRTMQRIQQGLILQGYRYIGGNAATWPLTDVLMENGQTILLVAVWHSQREDTLRQLWRGLQKQDARCGLLLVDVERSSAVLNFLVSETGDVAAVDAVSRHIHLPYTATTNTHRPTVLTQEGLSDLLDPARDTEAGQVDCLSALQAAVQPTEAPPRFIPWLTYGLMAICILIFLGMVFQVGLGGLWAMPTGASIEWGALFGPLVAQGQWWRMLTVALLHGSAFHLGMNMMAMYYFMSPLEAWQGRWRLAVVFLASVVSGSLLSLWWHPGLVGVGASGGLFGMLGFMAAILVRHGRSMPEQTRKGLFNWLKSIVIYNMIFSLLIPGIDFMAHLGGLIGGFIVGYALSVAPSSSARAR